MGIIPDCHDDIVLGLSIDCEARRVCIRGRSPNWEKHTRRWKAYFEGVEAYHFKNDAFSNIIMTIAMMPLDEFYALHQDELREAFRVNGAMGPWVNSASAAHTFMTEEGLTPHVITSSMGLEGWVLAKETCFIEE